jgi:hypothetical protein
MEFEELIASEIERYQKKIAELRLKLRKHLEAKQEIGDPSMRFFNWRPLHAAQVILEENGGTIKREEMEKLMVAGGMMEGRKRGPNNIRVGLNLLLKSDKKLKQNGEWICLP